MGGRHTRCRIRVEPTLEEVALHFVAYAAHHGLVADPVTCRRLRHVQTSERPRRHRPVAQSVHGNRITPDRDVIPGRSKIEGVCTSRQ